MVACTPQATATPVVLKETVQVEVEKQVEVTKMVEITAIPKTGPTNALGVTLPEDALPLDQQIYTIAMGKVGEQFGGAYGHEMESLYNRAYAMGLGSEALTSLDKEGKIIGAGCESWKQSDDGLYWDFKLPQNWSSAMARPSLLRIGCLLSSIPSAKAMILAGSSATF